MESMAEIVLAHGGIIDDYIGDGLKVDFGVPLARCDEPGISRDAVNAVSCALAMKREMQRLNAHWREHHLPTSALRIGIYTGPVLAGALGSPKRLKYTTLGDTVNIASRLESYGKDSIEFDAEHNPCRILIGETTWRYIGNQFKIEEVGQVLLKGKKQRIAAYLVIDRIRVKSQHVNPEERE
jgi:adenylate cyclase